MKLEIKPLSVNKAWQGRRFKTQTYKDYENDLMWLIKEAKPKKTPGLVEIIYEYYLDSKRFSISDLGNFEKPLTDIIVKSGLIDDDRYIMRLTQTKYKSEDNYITVEIKPWVDQLDPTTKMENDYYMNLKTNT